MATPLQELVGVVADSTAATEALVAASDRRTAASEALHRDVVSLMGEVRGQNAAKLAAEVARAEAWATLVRRIDEAWTAAAQSEALVAASRWVARTLGTTAMAFGAGLGGSLAATHYAGWW